MKTGKGDLMIWKKMTAIFLAVMIMFFLVMTGLPSCGMPYSEMPEDFAFSIVWGIEGESSYDSKTGELIKTTHASDPDQYAAIYKMSEDELKQVYGYLFHDMNLMDYPDRYDPFKRPFIDEYTGSYPPTVIRISVFSEREKKTVLCPNTAPFIGPERCPTLKQKQFMTAVRNIIDLISSSEEWQAFPDYEFYYE